MILSPQLISPAVPSPSSCAAEWSRRVSPTDSDQRGPDHHRTTSNHWAHKGGLPPSRLLDLIESEGFLLGSRKPGQ